MAFVAPNREAGRILYQGVMDQARGIAGAVNQFVDEGYKRQEQDKEFNAKLKVTEQALSTFIKPKAAEFGTTPEAIDAFLKVNPSESPKERYLRLGGFLEQAITSSKMTRDAQQAETQRKYTDALAKSAEAQGAASNAATAERLRQTRAAQELEKTVTKFVDYEKRAGAGSTNPLTDEEYAEYESLQQNPIIESALMGRRAGIADPTEAVRLGLTLRGQDERRNIEEQRRILEEQKIENQRLRDELKAEQAGLRGRAVVGFTKPLEVGGKKFNIEWDGKDWVEQKTGIPYQVSTRDMMGNTTGSTINPQLIQALGLSIPTNATPGMPGQIPGNQPGGTGPAPVIDINKATPTNAPAAATQAAQPGIPPYLARVPSGVPTYSGGAPAAPATPPPMTFNTMEEAEQAYAAGTLQLGQRVIIGGKPGTWQ